MTRADFGRFYDATAGPLHAWVTRATGDPDLADDVTQDAFVRFLRARSTPSDERAARVYLFRTARNLIRDRARSAEARARRSERWTEGWMEARRPGGRPGPEGPDGRATHDAHVTRVDVERALAGLRERDRDVVWLAHVVGMSHREIAEVIGVQEGSVKVLALRARRRFRELYERDEAGGDGAPAGEGATRGRLPSTEATTEGRDG